MVGLLTFGQRKYEDLDAVMRAAIEPLHTAMQKMISAVDRDTQAFTQYMASSYHTMSGTYPLIITTIGCTQIAQKY